MNATAPRPTPTHEWETLGDTFTHCASIPNASAGVQQGFKDGFVDARDMFMAATPNDWAGLMTTLMELRHGLRGHTPEYKGAYFAAVDSAVALMSASAPVWTTRG